MDLKVPAQVTELMQANVDRAIGAYEKATETMKSYGEAANTALEHQQALTRELGSRIFDNTSAKRWRGTRSREKAGRRALDSRGDEHSDGLRTKPG